MALTNFGKLTEHQYTVWSRDFWREARNRTFLMAFAGTGQNAMVQRVTELKTTRDGARAIITLLHDSVGDGVVGDNRLKDRESPLTSADQVIQIDQWRDAHRTEGEMAEQASLVKLRDTAKYALSYTASRVMDELGFLTLSGIGYNYHTDGRLRTGSELPQLKFASDVTAPTSGRYYRWDATDGLKSNDSNTNLAAADTPTWAMLVDAKAAAVNNYMRPITSDNGVECYNVFMSPTGIAALKKDKDFLAAWQHAQKRGEENPLFKGTQHGGKRGIHIDGLNILEYRNVFTTLGATSGSKWGGGTVDGQRVLLCGAQAMAFADIGNAKWTEEEEDYGNQWGIAVAKKYGMLKPSMYSIHSQSVEDFSVMCIDTAL